MTKEIEAGEMKKTKYTKDSRYHSDEIQILPCSVSPRFRKVTQTSI